MKFRFLLTFLFCTHLLLAEDSTAIWNQYELSFESTSQLDNPIYDIKEFYAIFSSPTGREVRVNGFWDGGQNFKIRFLADEIGAWRYETKCSNEGDQGLHGQQGQFICIKNTNAHEIYQKGAIERSPGDYFLRYADGTPFFFAGCTAWNGALKSTEEEWDKYLDHRMQNHYSAIQFVTTQWRGCEKDSRGEVAFTGSGKIEINPSFYQRLDVKFDEVNARGLVAAPVLLWALPKGDGRHFSPGYYLPDEEAILLARYMVARYGAHHVIWLLGGDGTYINAYEQRWKNIGRKVFTDYHPGVVAQHPGGSSWIGEAYKGEDWLDVVGYQSSHNNGEWVVNWINKGPMANTWDELPPKPIINLEPNYEEIFHRITATDVRNASYWSLFATPPAGITYGANGIWPWIQYEGEKIENHGLQKDLSPSTWAQSIEFPGSLQIGYLSAFIQSFEWWSLKPAPQILVEQPGDLVYNKFISVVSDPTRKTILAYTPKKQPIKVRNERGKTYNARWFDPIHNVFVDQKGNFSDQTLILTPPSEQDFILVLSSVQ